MIVLNLNVFEHLPVCSLEALAEFRGRHQFYIKHIRESEYYLTEEHCHLKQVKPNF